MNSFNNLIIGKGTSIFRRWSHKSYAVFNSIGKEVNIGFISTIVSRIKTTKTVLHQLFSIHQRSVLSSDDDIHEFTEQTEIYTFEHIRVSQLGFSANTQEFLADFNRFANTDIISKYNKIGRHRPFLLRQKSVKRSDVLAEYYSIKQLCQNFKAS